jgi:hypothetical protein
MSGSIDYSGYQDDTIATFAVRVDKSNSLGTCAGVPLMIPKAQAGTASRPYRFKLRYALAYNAANPLQRRKFYIGNPNAIPKVRVNGAQILAEDYPGPGDVAGTQQTWNVTYYSGERTSIVAFVTAPDTGLTV